MLHLWKRQMQTLLSRSLVDSWASCTIWQCVVRSFTKKRTFPWNMVFPDRRGEKANQSVHQWRQEFCCSWCRMCCHIPLNRKIRKIQNSWNVPFPLVWLEKSSGWISLLKDPHLLCRFDKEIYLLEKKKSLQVSALSYFVGGKIVVNGLCVSSASQDTKKPANLALKLNWFGFIWAILGVETAISTWIVVLETWNYFSSPWQRLSEEITSITWKYSAVSTLCEYPLVLHWK